VDGVTGEHVRGPVPGVDRLTVSAEPGQRPGPADLHHGGDPRVVVLLGGQPVGVRERVGVPAAVLRHHRQVRQQEPVQPGVAGQVGQGQRLEGERF
jgi:hypothetical protein